MDIVTVQYKNRVTGEFQGREYSYFASVDLVPGDEIMVPARGNMTAAKVARVNVPEDEVADYADRLLTISEVVPAAKPEEATETDPLAE